MCILVLIQLTPIGQQTFGQEFNGLIFSWLVDGSVVHHNEYPYILDNKSHNIMPSDTSFTHVYQQAPKSS